MKSLFIYGVDFFSVKHLLSKFSCHQELSQSILRKIVIFYMKFTPTSLLLPNQRVLAFSLTFEWITLFDLNLDLQGNFYVKQLPLDIILKVTGINYFVLPSYEFKKYCRKLKLNITAFSRVPNTIVHDNSLVSIVITK